MFHIALFEPEIPPNAGNVARLCAATGSVLHFIGRLGFRMDDKTLKRAGLDYWPHVNWKRHETWEAFLSFLPSPLAGEGPGVRGDGAIGETDCAVDQSRDQKIPLTPNPSPAEGEGDKAQNLWLVDNPAPTTYTKVRYAPGDCLVFGRESTGLPESIRSAHADRLIGIPMPTGHVRSLNLATSVGIVLYEALRQQHDW